jgi:hypothetical protein
MKLDENFFYAGDSIDNLLQLNIFTDILGDDPNGEHTMDTYSNSPEMLRMLSKYEIPAASFRKEILEQSKLGRKLTPLEADLAEHAFYDGSDMYNLPDMFLGDLDQLYAIQVETLRKILRDSSALSEHNQPDPEIISWMKRFDRLG